MDRIIKRHDDRSLSVFVGGVFWGRCVDSGGDMLPDGWLDIRAQGIAVRRWPDASILEPRQPTEDESYKDYLAWHMLLGSGFEFTEIVNKNVRQRLHPPRSLWANMIPTLALALLVRADFVAHGGGGLVITDAYRPASKRSSSRHKTNRALDLIPVQHMRTARGHATLAASSARVWAHVRHDLRAGLGHYGRPGSLATPLVHIDTGTRMRCWQYYGDRAVTPPSPTVMIR